jgi:hypothetical protein
MTLGRIFTRLARKHFRKRRGRRGRAAAGRWRSSFLSAAEGLEPRLALTVNVFPHDAGGDSPGYVAFVLDESGDDLYLRQTLQTIGAGSEPVSFLELADNPGFFSSFDVAFDTNSVVDGNNHQDIFVSQGVQNTWTEFVGSGRSTVLPDANNVAPPGGFAGLEADETFHVLPGTLGGSPNFFASNFVITLDNGAVDGSTFATQYLLDEQDGGVDGIWPLVFSNNQTSITLRFSGASDDDMNVTGTVNLYTGLVSLNYTGNGTTLNPQTTFFVNYASPVIADDPSTVTLATGLTVDAGFVVDLPSPDSTITIASPINSPARGTADAGLLDLRATNVLVNAPVVANDGVRALESRFHNSPSVETNVAADVYASNSVRIPPADAANVDIGARVRVGPDVPGYEWFPADTNVIAVNPVTGELTLSHVVSTLSGDRLEIFNPSSVASAQVARLPEPVTRLPKPDEGPLVQSATIYLDGPGPFDIQPGAVVGPQGAIQTDTYIPLNTFVAAVNTVTGRVDLTRPVSLPVGTTAVNFYNNGYDDTKVERFEATTVIESPSFNFHIADDLSSDIRERGLLYVAGSSGLRDVGGGTANLLTANVAASDIVFEGDVAVATQSYLFQTTIAEAPFTFTTKNSSGVSTGSLSGTTLDVTLANATPPQAENSVVQVVDLDTAVSSMRISAEDTTAMNPPFPAAGPDDHDPIPEGPFPFAITIRESDDLSIDANLASGGPVDVTVGGDLVLTATIQSSQDLTFTAVGDIAGTAWLTTVDGRISLEATDVDIAGLLQVLAAAYDETTIDVSVVATNGSVQLGQGIRAVNNVVVQQRSKTGSVSTQGILAARDVQVFADGDVTMGTASRFVEVSVASLVNGVANSPRTVEVNSNNPVEMQVSTAGGTARLTALGVDDPSLKALTATLRETGVLHVSVPQGSVDVISIGSVPLVLGEAANLLSGSAGGMTAAGSVSVRSTQSEITVLDAPLAGLGSSRVRTVAVGSLLGDYQQNTPGITPATLTALNKGSLNSTSLGLFGLSPANPLRTRDLVLLANQDVAKQNGIYQIVSLGNASQGWQLRRIASADMTAEFPVGTLIAVSDGVERGKVYKVDSYSNQLDATPLRVSEGITRAADEITVRLATEAILDGTFAAGAGMDPATITGTSSTLLVNSTLVKNEDLILVQFGAEPGGGGRDTVSSSIANGIYKADVSAVNWKLTRYKNPEKNDAVVAEATVVVSEGVYRTSRSGSTFTVAYDGLGLVDLSIRPDQSIKGEIGSYDPRDLTTLVVSTAGGTNDAAGSLGKMLQLVQQNQARDLADQEVLQELRFGNVLGSVTGVTGTISLRQELPEITKPIVIDAANRFTIAAGTSQPLVIDGSRITASTENTFVTRGTEVNGFTLKASADTTDPFRPLPSRLSSLRLGGFEQGAAIVVDGASNVSVENVIVGQNAVGNSQAVRYGIRVTGDSGVDGPVSIVGATVTSAMIPTNLALGGIPASPVLDGAGVLIDGSARNVQLVGGSYGSQAAGNVIGVLVRSDNLPESLNSVGVLESGRFRTNVRLSTRELVIPDTDTLGNAVDMTNIYVGQAVTGIEFAPNTRIVAVDAAERTVMLNNAIIATNSAALVTLATPNRTVVAGNFWGVELESGATRIVNSDIRNNILDGIVVGSGFGDQVFAAIGAGKIAGASSNAIFGNGRNGIRFADLVTSSNGGEPGRATISIEGNYIGRAVNSTTFVGNGQGSYFWVGDSDLPVEFPSYSSLSRGTKPQYITDDSLFNLLVTPSPEGSTTDANGNVNSDFFSGTITPPEPPGPPPPNDGNS